MENGFLNTNGKTKRWKKILYEDSGYPDNFTPEESFLAAIEKNKNVRLYEFQECLLGAAVVGQELSVVLIFWSLYECLKLSRLTADLVLGVLLALVLSGFSYTSLVNSCTWSDIVKQVRAGALLVTMGYSVSPVLYQLTDTISTDTIHTMAVLGLLLHLLTHNYGLNSPVVSASISLNAAVFSAVCLASRFSSHYSAFSLLCLSTTCFLLLPLSRPSLPPSFSSSLLLGLSSLLLVSSLSTTAALLSACLLLSVQLACPLLFYRLQQYKSTIHGPWDEAVPH